MPRIRLGLAVMAAVGLTGSWSAASAPSIEIVQSIVTGPNPLDSFRRPLGVAVDTTRGVTVIADTGRHRLVFFDRFGRSRGFVRIGESETGEPTAVALDERGRLFVVDPLRARVDVLTSRGTRIASIAPDLPGDVAAAAVPQDVQVGASGRVYVLYGGPRPGLVIVGPDATVFARIGFEIPENNVFRTPVALAVSGDETEIAVADPEAEHPIVILAPDGEVRAALGTHGEGDGGFSLACDVAWGPGGTLWVTDTLRHSISVFDDRGEYLGRIGGFGFGPGQFYHPISCAFVGGDRLLVLERAGARFQVLEVSIPSAPAGDPS